MPALLLALQALQVWTAAGVAVVMLPLLAKQVVPAPPVLAAVLLLHHHLLLLLAKVPAAVMSCGARLAVGADASWRAGQLRLRLPLRIPSAAHLMLHRCHCCQGCLLL